MKWQIWQWDTHPAESSGSWCRKLLLLPLYTLGLGHLNLLIPLSTILTLGSCDSLFGRGRSSSTFVLKVICGFIVENDQFQIGLKAAFASTGTVFNITWQNDLPLAGLHANFTRYFCDTELSCFCHYINKVVSSYSVIVRPCLDLFSDAFI